MSTFLKAIILFAPAPVCPKMAINHPPSRPVPPHPVFTPPFLPSQACASRLPTPNPLAPSAAPLLQTP